MAISRTRKALFTGLVGSVAAATVIGLGVAHADPQPTNAAATEMPFAVENFSYPGAAQIQQEQQILLKRGDGNITLVPCTGSNDILVKSRIGQKSFCFDVRGPKGFVTLELKDSFGMWTGEHPVKATIDSNGTKTVVEAPANDYQPIGETGDIGQRSILVELRVTG